MSVISVNSRAVMGSLTSLLHKMASAVGWVNQQGNTALRLNVESLSDPVPTIGPQAGCPGLLDTDDRVDVEVLMAVLAAMQERGALRVRSKAKKKSKKRK